MKNNLKKLSLIIGTIIIGIALFTGCSKKDEIKDAFNIYKNAWIKQDFKSMYNMLSVESKAYINEEEFLERYTNIYSAIVASNMDIQIVGEKERDKKSLEIPFTMTMDTVAGKVDIKDYKATLVKEEDGYKVKWNESLIFPQMEKPDDKVRVEDYYSKRGSILDRNGNFLA